MTIEWMHCTTCKATVQINSTGQCLACHRGFTGIPAEDSYDYFLKSQEVVVESNGNKLEEVNRNANEKSGPKSMDARKQTKNGRKVGKTHAKRKKTTKKSKKKKEVKHGV